MTNQNTTPFDRFYKDLVTQIMVIGSTEFNQRTGYTTKAVTGTSHSFRPDESFPLLTLRKVPLKLFIAEQMWYLQGDKELDFFQQFSHIWDNFKEDDNTVESGYGYRWRHFFGRDQIKGLIQKLRNDPTSRQGVVMTWDPSSDGLNSQPKKNVPCVPMWVVNIVNQELNLHFVFRSQDVMLGLPHDVAGFALLQLILAQELGVKPGWLHYSGSHCHIYENHFEKAEEIMQRTHEHSEIIPLLPENTFSIAEQKDSTVVQDIYEMLKHQYNPLPPLGKMSIAL